MMVHRLITHCVPCTVIKLNSPCITVELNLNRKNSLLCVVLSYRGTIRESAVCGVNIYSVPKDIQLHL